MNNDNFQNKSVFFKYPLVNPRDVQWGFYLTVAGYTKIPPHSHYPPREHPQGYHYEWQGGRKLDEFQCIYITRGKGVYEASERYIDIQKGDVIFLFPGVWHRYHPDPETGWDEYYFGFKGSMAHHYWDNRFISVENDVVHVGSNQNILDLFKNIFDCVEHEYPGFQQAVSGKAIEILGRVYHSLKHREPDGVYQSVIIPAKTYFNNNISNPVDIEAAAEMLNIGYSHFRKLYKKYTGLSPGQYVLQLKIQKAREYLLSGNKSVKEIAFLLGFNSNFYFSRLFKQKTGFSPLEFRQNNRKGVEL